MHGRQFDDLAKAMAAGMSRRKAISGLFGGVMAALSWAVAGRSRQRRKVQDPEPVVRAGCGLLPRQVLQSPLLLDRRHLRRGRRVRVPAAGAAARADRTGR